MDINVCVAQHVAAPGLQYNPQRDCDQPQKQQMIIGLEYSCMHRTASGDAGDNIEQGYDLAIAHACNSDLAIKNIKISHTIHSFFLRLGRSDRVQICDIN